MEARPVCDKEGKEKGFTFNPTAANRALKLIGKHKGMFIDRKLSFGNGSTIRPASISPTVTFCIRSCAR